MSPPLRTVTLKDKYELESGVAYMSGTQALVRIAMAMRRRDIAAGLNTGGYISGYRGSPLGSFDREVERAQKILDGLNVKFHAGVNEDLAATAVWGTQQVNLLPGANVDGVFGIWYGKSPGVDRSGDVMRHANAAGTAPKGGVLAIVGDDPGCKSSTLPSQSDHDLYAMQIPMLFPASIQEFVEYGVLGIEMSRFSGCWVALKVTSETVETSGTVDLSREDREIGYPTAKEFEMPPGGLSIRLNDAPRDIDWRLQNYKLFACHAFARKNKIDRVVMDSPKPRFGIITSGKSYGDVRQALFDLGITDDVAAEIGLRLYKVGMPWPLEPENAHDFVEGLEEILIVEEKREFIENQLKQQIFNWPPSKRPIIVGKYDEDGKVLLRLESDLTVGMVARVIAQRIARFYTSPRIDEALKFYETYEKDLGGYTPPSLRKPYYCSGCPHNTSTKVPEGSFAMVGIGCHYMVQWMDRNSALCTQMGGEGVPWLGAAPFTSRKHIFANLGDGTYFHSGTLAIRAAVASDVNITYKILYNDAVAMTGGQAVDGTMPVWRVAQQVMAEGVAKCWIVSENPEAYAKRENLPKDVEVFHRDFMDAIQKQAREMTGTTVIIYDQTCAAEKRRRRKRGSYPDPAKRVVINSAVCEGCGDCSVQSNCISVQPLETEFGRKRTINQSSCNKDFSCVKGFCPSFVTVEGGKLRKTSRVPAESALETDDGKGRWRGFRFSDQKGDATPDVSSDESPISASGEDALLGSIPDIAPPPLKDSYNVMVTGVGGTGVLTVGALMGMAAHLEGAHCAVLDMTGLAQKGGEVLSHVRLGSSLDVLSAGHIITGGADLLLACDEVSAAGKNAYETLNRNRTRAVINTHYTPVAEFVLNNDSDFHQASVRSAVIDAVRPDGQYFVEASGKVAALLGDEIGANIFMLGFAWQKGLIPLSRAALERALEINGVAIEENKKAFAYGRLAAHAPEKIDELVKGHDEPEAIATTLDEIVGKRFDFLKAYQSKRYAKRYLRFVDRARATGNDAIATTIAKAYHKLLAYKDEYEVARLYTNGDFLRSVQAQFEGDYKLKFHMAPPIFEKIDPATGRPKKRQFGPAMFFALRVLKHFKFLRGTALDPFGGLKDRKEERRLIAEYEALVERVLPALTPTNAEIAVELLSLPLTMRGFGPVKAGNVEKARAQEARLLSLMEGGVVIGGLAAPVKPVETV